MLRFFVRIPLIRVRAMVFALLVVALLASADAQYLTYWHNWASSDGETHLTLCNMTQGWQALSFQPGQMPLFVNHWNVTGQVGLTWFFTPPFWKPASYLHTNPVIQWGVWFSGAMRFAATDGTEVLISPGEVYFGDDVGSKGHHSENAGYGPALSAMITYKGVAGKGPCWPSDVDWM